MDYAAIEAMAHQEGFARICFLPPRPPGRWLKAVARRGQTEFARELKGDPARRYPFASCLIFLAYPYQPFAPGERIPSFYLAWRKGQAAAKRLTQRLVLAGARAQQASDLPIRGVALENGVGCQGRNGLLYLEGLGSRCALFLLATDAVLPRPVTGQERFDCGACTKCADACPAGAIHMDRGLTPIQCMRGHMNQPPFAPWVEREMTGYIGCEICQQVCPRNGALGLAQPDAQQRAAFDSAALARGKTTPAQALAGWRFSGGGKLPYQAGVFRRRDRGGVPQPPAARLELAEASRPNRDGMLGDMFCYQCEQTAGGRGCTGCAGACGKDAAAAKLQDELTGALIGLGQAARGRGLPQSARNAMLTGLFAGITNVNFSHEDLAARRDEIRRASHALAGDCAQDYPMERIWGAPEDVRSAKSLLLFGLRGMAAYAHHARILGYENRAVTDFFPEALRALGEEHSPEELLAMALRLGEVNLRCMELLDRANTETYGDPVPTTVTMRVESGPFIVVTGHDLEDLELLLRQTRGTGVNVYTHGEMLPAHAYPKLKKYPHLKGNFGTAWHNQHKEFDGLPAPVLFTTNCLTPPLDSYRDRVFTTGPVSFPGTVHIGEDKDFWPVIRRALELEGFEQDRLLTGVNGGAQVTTGFGHRTVLDAAPAVLAGLKSGAIRHLFLVAGCDGAKPGRGYYTDFVKLAPQDTLILTLACGKYRFNDFNLGEAGGLPRILDMGQCNDAYSAIVVAKALAQALDCGINDLPLSMVLSWYEQKAVCILLTLLHLGVKNILLGPSMPAFLSANVRELLEREYGLRPISSPEADLKSMLGALPWREESNRYHDPSDTTAPETCHS